MKPYLAFSEDAILSWIHNFVWAYAVSAHGSCHLLLVMTRNGGRAANGSRGSFKSCEIRGPYVIWEHGTVLPWHGISQNSILFEFIIRCRALLTVTKVQCSVSLKLTCRWNQTARFLFKLGVIQLQWQQYCVKRRYMFRRWSDEPRSSDRLDLTECRTCLFVLNT
jgi:hypothetical protein